MSGLHRYVRLLRLFGEEHDTWTIPDMAAQLRVPASTVYRTVREMVAEGFLEVANEAQYRLGATFVEYDRLIRITDPLYRAGMPMLREVSIQARIPCVAVLARLHNDTVMCVADASTPDGSVQTSYERGRPRPLTRGATSKVILADLPSRRLTKLLTGAEATADSVPGKPIAELREELAGIRRRRFAITRGEVDKGLVGIAAPVTTRGLVGSLSLVVRAASLNDMLERRLVLLVVSSASLLTEQLANAELSKSVANGGALEVGSGSGGT